ncbi:MAG: glucose-6-phosphate isomerase family protein [Caldilineaceae bacterium]
MPMTPFTYAREFTQFDPQSGAFAGATVIERHLSDLQQLFVDQVAYEQTLAQADPLLYTVAAVQPDDRADALFYAIGKIFPGQIGAEYYMTKGHYHALRTAPEVYIGLHGQGMMLLQDEASGSSRAHPLLPHSIVYVPGHTAHRTINTGTDALVYLAVCPLAAGHDYESIVKNNFQQIVVAVNGEPTVLDRSTFVTQA